MAKKKIGEFLVEKGVLSRQELTNALIAQRSLKVELGQVLVQEGYIRETQLIPLLGEFFDLPVFSAQEADLRAEVIAMVPYSIVLKNRILPVALKENELTIACSEPVNNALLENLRRFTGKKIGLVLMGQSELERLIQQVYPDAGMEAAAGAVQITVPEDPDYAIKLLDQLISKAILQRASDVHLEPEPDCLRVRMRIDGILNTIDKMPANIAPPLISRIKVLANMNIAERRSSQDGGFFFSDEQNNYSANVRASTLPCVRGEKAVLRILPSQEKVLDIEELGMEKDVLDSFRHLLEIPHGLLLVTGPTGSGKSSTLYAALKYLRNDNVNIVTVEDPVELQMEGINQIQVDEVSRKVTFSSALRAILRQDPDIIMIGEIRDEETASLALKAALTGHLVISTLHTNDAASAVERLIDMGCERFLVSSALRGVLALRLVRMICPKCVYSYMPNPGELLSLGLDAEKQEEFKAGRGCGFCRETGYLGRTGIFELLVIDHNLQKLIANDVDSAEIKEYAQRKMRTIREDGIIKLRKGITTISEVLRATTDL